jgi:hypothetical protein
MSFADEFDESSSLAIDVVVHALEASGFTVERTDKGAYTIHDAHGYLGYFWLGWRALGKSGERRAAVK